jgi:parallel beta-helix repeat protein
MHTAMHHRKIALFIFEQVRLFIFICFLLVTPAFADAAVYYVDAQAGNDGNKGTTTRKPWKTIGKVNGSAFRPGDSILFKRGSIWREQLIIPSSGSAGNPITFGAYGTGAKPVISGSNVVSARSWTLYSGNIYVANAGDIPSPTQLYVDGTYYDIAHYPNSGYLLATANSTDTTSIIDSNLTLSADQIVGATAMVRAVSWYISTLSITAYDPATHTITLNAPLLDASTFMKVGFGFYLQNMLWMLDSPKEWYYDPSAGKLYLWTASGDYPGNHTVEFSSRAYGLLNMGRKYVTIQDLAITGANRYDIYVSDANNVIVKNCELSGGQVGIYFTSTSYSSILYNSVWNTLGNGIQVSWNMNNIDVSNNTINNAGNVGVSPKESYAGLYFYGTAINITNNTITNSGYNGISYNGNLVDIRNNVIDKSCLVLDDCGGIYTSAPYVGNKPDLTATTSNIIRGNTVTNSVGNFSGTALTYTKARGVYLDDGTHGTTVYDNTVYNTDHGIYIRTGHSNSVTGNAAYRARIYGFFIIESGVAATAPGVVHDNVVTGNTFETVSTGATACYFSDIEDATNFGTYDHNRYCHPNSDFVVSNQGVNYNLLAWQQKSGQDLNSTDTKSSCTPPLPTVTFTAAPTAVAKGGASTLTWSSTNATSCVAGGAWSGTKPVSDSQVMANLTTGKTYNLTCSGIGGTTTKSVTVTVNSQSTARTRRR